MPLIYLFVKSPCANGEKEIKPTPLSSFNGKISCSGFRSNRLYLP
jgi:hypothetical protein